MSAAAVAAAPRRPQKPFGTRRRARGPHGPRRPRPVRMKLYEACDPSTPVSYHHGLESLPGNKLPGVKLALLHARRQLQGLRSQLLVPADLPQAGGPGAGTRSTAPPRSQTPYVRPAGRPGLEERASRRSDSCGRPLDGRAARRAQHLRRQRICAQRSVRARRRDAALAAERGQRVCAAGGAPRAAHAPRRPGCAARCAAGPRARAWPPLAPWTPVESQ